MTEMETQSDHDLLVRIDEQVKQMRASADAERLSTASRLSTAETDIVSLRMSRAQFFAITTTISFLMAILIKVFWK